MTITTRRLALPGHVLFTTMLLSISATGAAYAEARSTDPKWNASTFGAACQKSNKCMGTDLAGGGYGGNIYDGDKTYTVTCTKTRCIIDGPSGGGPARTAQPDKLLGTNAAPTTGTLAGTKPDAPKRLAVPGKFDTPKQLDTPKRIDMPKTSDLPRSTTVKIDAPKRVDVPKTGSLR